MSKEAMKLMVKALEDCNRSDMKIVEDAITAGRQAIAEAEKQEPVACKKLCELCEKRGYNFCVNSAKTTPIPVPVAQPPQQRTWVGLTDEELKPFCDENYIAYGAYTVDFIKAIEAKLKEKNT